MRRKAIYIAGPYRGEDCWVVENNVRRAEEVALEIAVSTHQLPLCPHTMFRFFDGVANDQLWIELTQELLRRADAVVLLQGWWRSSGTMGEIKLAEERGIPVFDSLMERVDEELREDNGDLHIKYNELESRIGDLEDEVL